MYLWKLNIEVIVLKRFLIIFIFILGKNILIAQYEFGDRWYTNPLGFKPLKLHTSMGFLVPAAVVGVSLLLSDNDSAKFKKTSIYSEAGVGWGYKYPYTLLPQINTGVNIIIRRWLSVGAELDVYFPKDDFNSTSGIAIRPFARFYPVNNDSWKLYFESGGGLIYFFDYFPKPTDRDGRLGTQLNGTTKYGLGCEIYLSEFTDLIFGLRHLHISNGNTKGVERNPSHDSNGLFVGFVYKFKNYKN